jgi:hypothetical protein
VCRSNGCGPSLIVFSAGFAHFCEKKVHLNSSYLILSMTTMFEAFNLLFKREQPQPVLCLQKTKKE